MGQKWIGPLKEAIRGPMRRHTLAVHWPNQVVLSGRCFDHIPGVWCTYPHARDSAHVIHKSHLQIQKSRNNL